MNSTNDFETLCTELERVNAEHKSVTAKLACLDPTGQKDDSRRSVVEALSLSMTALDNHTSDLAIAVEKYNKAKVDTLTAHQLALDAKLIEVKAQIDVAHILKLCKNIGRDVDRYRSAIDEQVMGGRN
jgi:hypothetical protein